MLSLAAGTALDAQPAHLIDAAAAAGFDSCGLRLDPSAVSARDARDIVGRLQDSGLRLLDLEVVRMVPGQPTTAHEPLLDLAAALGATWVLTVLQLQDVAERVERLAELDELAAARGLQVSLEFMAFTDVHTLSDALDLVALVPRCRVLVDALHLARTKGTVDEVAAAADRVCYVQLCDGPAQAPGSGEPDELADEARHRRLLPGDGEFDLTGLVRSVAGTVPMSVEVQSDLMTATLSVAERAQRAYASATHVIAHAGQP